MKRSDTKYIKRTGHAAVGSLTAAALLGTGMVMASPPEKPWKQGEILVKPKAGLPQAELDRVLKRHGGRGMGRLRALNVRRVRVPAQAEDAMVRALSKNPHIEFAEKDMAVELSEIIPDDPQFGDAWHLPKITAPAAWRGSQGDGITVAVIDTGVNGAHPDLTDKMEPGWNVVNGDSDSSDVFGHGTAVAGTVAAATNNAMGVASVAWNARIMPVRITNSSDGYAYFSDIANGLTWAADHGADVANISYGVSNSSTVSAAAQHMRALGGVVVVAGGNNGQDTGYSDNPAMISVSATTSDDSKASWSNYGDFIDVAAPGLSILSTTSSGGYKKWSGTSFASPVTAGVVALIMSANPELTPDQVEEILEQSADDPVSGSDFHIYFGNGRVNAAAAVEMALSVVADPGDMEAPVATIFTPVGGATVSGQVAVDVSADDNVGVERVELLAGDMLVGTDSTSPYRFSWDSTGSGNGDVTLTAYVYDSAGNEGVSKAVTVTVDNQQESIDTIAPTASILTPVAGAMISGQVAVDVSADDNVGVDRVELFAGSERIGTATTPLYQFSWDSTSHENGDVTLTAYAYDSAGNESVSKAVTVTVDNQQQESIDTVAPTARILSPTDGAIVSRNINITAKASDDQQLSLIKLYIDDSLKASTSNTTVSYKWNIRKASGGSHTIKVQAWDAAGNTATDTIEVSISTRTKMVRRGKKNK